MVEPAFLCKVSRLGIPPHSCACYHVQHNVQLLLAISIAIGVVCMQVLVSVPALRDFCTQPQRRPQIRKGPIGAALQELVQTVYGAHRSSHLVF